MGRNFKKKPILIATCERGPGPGNYGLPTTCGYMEHDPTRRIQPAFSLGERLKGIMVRTDCSPGPIYPTNSKVTRYGLDGTPSYSILGRQKEINLFKTPSPGAYSPEKAPPPLERTAPKPSMGTRTRFRKSDPKPSPNCYSLPPLLGPNQASQKSYPSYSMTGQTYVGCYCQDYSKTPGPGQYNACEPNVIRKRQPRYSLPARTRLPGDGTQKPGPGHYRPENVFINKAKSARHSLGIRHSEFVCPMLIHSEDQ